MPEIGHSIANHVGNIDVTGTSWSSDANVRLPSTDMDAGEKYMVFAQAVHGSTSGNNNNDELQIEFNGAGIASSLSNHESRRSGGAQGHPYGWLGELTQPGGGAVNIQMQHKSVASNTHRIKSARLLALKVGDLTSDQYKFASTTPSGDASTTFTAGASITLPSDTDKWLVLYCTHWLSDEVASDMKMRLDVDGANSDEYIIESEATDEEYCIAWGTVHTNGGSDVLTVEYAAENSSTHDCDYTAIVAINLTAFLAGGGSEDTGDTNISTTTGTWTTVSQFDDIITGDGTRNYCAIGGALIDAAESAKRHEHGIEYRRDSGSWATLDSMDGNVEAVGHGSGDQWGVIMLDEITDLADTELLDLRIQAAEHSDVTPNPVAIQGWGAAFSWELAGGTTYDDAVSEPQVWSDTYDATVTVNAGVVESMTVNDAVTAAAAVAAAISESLIAGETLVANASVAAAITESFIADDSEGINNTVPGDVAETAVLTDTQQAIASAAAAVAEALTIGETWAAQVVASAAVTETFDLSDALTGESAAEVDETTDLQAQFTAAASVIAATSDTATLQDAITALATVFAAVGENAQFDGSYEGLLVLSREISDTITVGDSTTAIATLIGAILADIDLAATYAASAVASAVISDEIAINVTFAATVVVAAGSLDQLVGSVAVIAALSGQIATTPAETATPSTKGAVDADISAQAALDAEGVTTSEALEVDVKVRNE